MSKPLFKTMMGISLVIFCFTMLCINTCNDDQQKTPTPSPTLYTPTPTPEFSDVIKIPLNAFVKVMTGAVRVRENPSTDAAIVTRVYQNELMQVLDRSEEPEVIGDYYSFWYKVRTYTLEEGWVYGEWLIVDESRFEDESIEIEKARYHGVRASVLEDYVNFRTSPSTGAEKLGRLFKSDTITLLGRYPYPQTIRDRTDYWYYVQQEDGTTGWIFGQFIHFDEETLPDYTLEEILAVFDIARKAYYQGRFENTIVKINNLMNIVATSAFDNKDMIKAALLLMIGNIYQYELHLPNEALEYYTKVRNMQNSGIQNAEEGVYLYALHYDDIYHRRPVSMRYKMNFQLPVLEALLSGSSNVLGIQFHAGAESLLHLANIYNELDDEVRTKAYIKKLFEEPKAFMRNKTHNIEQSYDDLAFDFLLQWDNKDLSLEILNGLPEDRKDYYYYYVLGEVLIYLDILEAGQMNIERAQEMASQLPQENPFTQKVLGTGI